jgi:hypothetical protein
MLVVKQDITDKINHTRKVWLMNIKENIYIYSYNHNSKLIEELKAKENNHKNIVFDTAIEYVDTPLLSDARTY